MNSKLIFQKSFIFTANQALQTSQFGQFLTSELDGNPPLWVTRRGRPGHEEVFINNARITAPDYEAVTANAVGPKRRQVWSKNFEIFLSLLCVCVFIFCKCEINRRKNKFFILQLSRENFVLIYSFFMKRSKYEFSWCLL